MSTRAEIERAVAGLAFVGTQGGDGPEVDRFAAALARRGRSLESCLALDALHDPTEVSAAEVTAELDRLLPAGCRPALTLIPIGPGALPGREFALQAVSAVDPVERDSPAVAVAGPVIAVAGQMSDVDTGMVPQTAEVMARTADLLAAHGASWNDAVRFDVFYRAEGTTEGWAENARERARHFLEPGPATTGIPVCRLPGVARIQVRALAVRDARALRAHSWPQGHWDWPFHLPYKHGVSCAGTAFVGGQVSLTSEAAVLDPDRLDLQTARSVRNILRVIAELGKGPENLLRLMAFYVHDDAGAAKTVEEVVRAELGGLEVELSLIGLPYLAYERMVVEIEAEVR
ncbi:RidA family protein [Nocardia alni]|uniref:RidA family protein n=1 Tax=Nocardia alni TaxID=2815723 RepID=UPI001C22C6C5|nr:RidA family protein [Nocardia alni]